MKSNPKIVATIVFVFLVAMFSFMWGYKQDKNRLDKDGKKFSTLHHFWNGMKWVGIVFAIMSIVGVTLAIGLQMNFWQTFLFGGDLIHMCATLVIELLSALSN